MRANWRRSLLTAVFGLVLGCGPSFRNDGEELAYLNSLSNPTASQWKRRVELTEKERRRKEEEDRQSRAKWVAEPPPPLNEHDEVAKDRLKRAQGHEESGNADSAIGIYRIIVEMNPNTPEAQIAADRLKALAK